jgi:hypothetical protein
LLGSNTDSSPALNVLPGSNTFSTAAALFGTAVLDGKTSFVLLKIELIELAKDNAANGLAAAAPSAAAPSVFSNPDELLNKLPELGAGVDTLYGSCLAPGSTIGLTPPLRLPADATESGTPGPVAGGVFPEAEVTAAVALFVANCVAFTAVVAASTAASAAGDGVRPAFCAAITVF